MKPLAIHRFRRKLQDGEPLCGLWVTLEAGAISDIAAGLGMDWIALDMAHSHLDWSTMLEHVRATSRSDTVALAQLPEAHPGLIRRALDIGVDGIVFPETTSAAQLREAAQWLGSISSGSGERNAREQQVASLHPLLASWISSRVDSTQGERPSLDMDFFFYGFGTGFPAAETPAAGSVAAPRRGEIAGAVRDSGKHLGIVSRNGESLDLYREEGFRILGVGIDRKIILEEMQSMLQLAKAPAATRGTHLPPSRKAVKLPRAIGGKGKRD